jgi:aspartyl-tRNA(Asn)/glutamyl-tRNA(Gln) amidotransferase subunit A
MIKAQTTLTELHELLRTKKISPSEITQFYWQRSQKLNPQLNAFISFNEQALEQAKQCDQALSSVNWDKTPLFGIPLGIKDMFCTQGLRTTAASRMLENFVPAYDATVVKKLKDAGALVLGKLNQDEFAMGSSNEFSYFGPCKNPWNLNHVPGGSSGGSAAAVAAGMVPASLGTDTGGSIRQPAHFCGIVGIKPTYGRISRYGIIAFASSLDQAGPMTLSVDDAALMLEWMCGADHKDQTSSHEPVPAWSKDKSQHVRGLRVGIIDDYISHEGLSLDIRKVFDEAVSALRANGAEVVHLKSPLSMSHGISVYYLVASSEASSNLARYDGVRYGYRANFENFHGVSLEEFYSRNRGEGFGFEVKSRIMLGTYALSAGYYDAYYKKACQVRRLIQKEFLDNFQRCDFILSPVSTTTAFALGERSSNPVQMYFNDVFTVSANLAGLPGLVIPTRLDSKKLPIGLQLLGRPWDEKTLFQAGRFLEAHFSFLRSYQHEQPQL